jgi:hypothetical protein
MYFWRITRLKSDIISNSLTDHQIFQYFFATLIVNTAIVAITGILFQSDIGLWDYIAAILTFTITIIGTYYVYFCNGGREGVKFFHRYFPLAWVTSIRVTVMLVPIAFIFMVVWEILTNPNAFIMVSEEPMVTRPVDVIVLYLVIIVYYWRLSIHISDVTQRTTD